MADGKRSGIGPQKIKKYGQPTVILLVRLSRLVVSRIHKLKMSGCLTFIVGNDDFSNVKRPVLFACCMALLSVT